MTLGRFVADPWPRQLERQTGHRVVNLARSGAGPDAWLHDDGLRKTAGKAQLRLIQIPDAVNLNNALYRVHPRRNDAFLTATPRLQRLYPEVDFMEFTFTRHMIRALARRGPERFAEVVGILTRTWLDRMDQVVQELGRPMVLLWFGNRPPPLPDWPVMLGDGAPLLVDGPMVQAVAAHVDGYAEVVVTDYLDQHDGKAFAPATAAAARLMPSMAAHGEIARVLLPWIAALMANGRHPGRPLH